MTTKERVLALLEAHRGEHFSGAQLAASLGVSRNAVWKAVTELRAAGCRIDAATNRGYCYAAENDLLSVLGILPLLSETARPLAAHLQVFPELASTNQTAKELALAGAAHGTAVIAERQTQGRGRYMRSFCSPPGGLYISMILHPDRLNFAHITTVTALAGAAVCEAVEAVSGKKPGIKWVNDVFLDGKKICGILTEAVTDIESGTLGWLVLGIGINVTTRTEDFPPELREIAGSVFGEDVPGSRNRLAAELLNRIPGCVPAPAEAEVIGRYRSRLMMLGRQVTVVQSDGTEYSAAALDIDEAGHLIVETAAGERRVLSSGEIRIRMQES